MLEWNLPDWLWNFTTTARASFAFAREEARQFSHNFNGTEHLLLGLIRASDGRAAQALAHAGVDLASARAAVAVIIGRGDGLVAGTPGLTPNAKQALAAAKEAAREVRPVPHPLIDTEQVLLGILRTPQCTGMAVLHSLGIDPQALYAFGLTQLPKWAEDSHG